QLPTADDDRVPGRLGDAAQLVENEAGDGRVVACRKVQSHVLQVVDREAARNVETARRESLHRQDISIRLVVDLSDEFFEQILDGDDPLAAPVRVGDYGQIGCA